MSLTSFLQDAALLILGGSGTGAAAMFTYLRSRKGDRRKDAIAAGRLELDNRREDGAAYERASEINQQIVAGLRQELTALQETIRDLRADAVLKEQENANLLQHIRSLEASAAEMRRLLAQAGIEYSANNLEGTE